MRSDTTQRTSSPTTVLDAIGNTPLVRVDGIWMKLEFLNPSGSIKARLAKYVIERAEAEGQLRPGDTIVEASSGNTGNALSLVAAVKGYRMLVVMPAGLSSERLAISRAYGAEVELVGDFHVGAAVSRALALGRRPGYFCPQQFENEWNVEENEQWLGPELLGQLPDDVVPDALVCGVGTGGTLIGVGRALRSTHPLVELWAVEPSESPTLSCGDVARHQLQGINDGFIPGIAARSLRELDGVVRVAGADALREMRRLARTHGLLVGPTSAAHLLAARRLRDERAWQTVVTFCSDSGMKYLAEHWSHP